MLRLGLSEIKEGFLGRIPDFDYASAMRFGVVVNRSNRLGLSMHPIDAFLLAVAERHELSLVTRNIKHFEKRTEINLVNPFR